MAAVWVIAASYCATTTTHAPTVQSFTTFTAASGEVIELDLHGQIVKRWPNVSVHDAASHDSAHSAAPHEGDHTGGLMFLMCVCLVIGWCWRKIEHFVGNCDMCGHSIPSVIPFTVLLLFSGMAIGALNRVIGRSDYGGLGYSIDYWREKDPHYLMYLFLPPLIFSSARELRTASFVISFRI